MRLGKVHSSSHNAHPTKAATTPASSQIQTTLSKIKNYEEEIRSIFYEKIVPKVDNLRSQLIDLADRKKAILAHKALPLNLEEKIFYGNLFYGNQSDTSWPDFLPILRGIDQTVDQALKLCKKLPAKDQNAIKKKIRGMKKTVHYRCDLAASYKKRMINDYIDAI